jgi:hypothetical protein
MSNAQHRKKRHSRSMFRGSDRAPIQCSIEGKFSELLGDRSEVRAIRTARHRRVRQRAGKTISPTACCRFGNCPSENRVEAAGSRRWGWRLDVNPTGTGSRRWGTTKKQECKFNKTRRRYGVLRTPTHRTKTKTSCPAQRAPRRPDGAQFHSPWVGDAGGRLIPRSGCAEPVCPAPRECRVPGSVVRAPRPVLICRSGES